MGFFVIKGTFHVKGYSPDGDSLRFKAADESKWSLLGGPNFLAINSQKHVQLRLEAIDTPETHYAAPGGIVHQPMALALAATDYLLEKAGITSVVWNAAGTRIESAADGTPGYILSRQKDRNGRPIAFAFSGAPEDPDGSDVFFTTTLLKSSFNYQSLAAGHAYPTFYTGLFADLRDELAAATATARAAGTGLYATDRTNAGVEVDAITDVHVILPKLFRRLVEFIGGESSPDLTGFLSWLEAKDEGVLHLPTANFTHFDDLITVVGGVVTLTELPENLVFNG